MDLKPNPCTFAYGYRYHACLEITFSQGFLIGTVGRYMHTCILYVYIVRACVFDLATSSKTPTGRHGCLRVRVGVRSNIFEMQYATIRVI